MGDYINISAVNGHVRPIWTSTLNGGTIYTAIVDTIYVGINRISDIAPSSYSLHQNYPNPFNPSTKIKFEINKSGDIVLNVYDVTGKIVSEIVNEYLTAGTYEVTFDGNNLPSGVYFYQLRAGEFTDTKKLILLK